MHSKVSVTSDCPCQSPRKCLIPQWAAIIICVRRDVSYTFSRQRGLRRASPVVARLLRSRRGTLSSFALISCRAI